MDTKLLRKQVALLLLQKAEVAVSTWLQNDILRVAANVENCHPVEVDGYVSDAVCRAAQDVAGAGHYEEARSIIEGER
jgi:hypothetical protein